MSRLASTRVESPFLTAEGAVEYLKLGSLSALYRLVREHRLPYGRLGRLYRFDKRRLDTYMETSGRSIELVSSVKVAAYLRGEKVK